METKPSQTDEVDEWMKAFNHPLREVLERLREIILETDSEIGEEIKWNAPSFFYTGAMQPFDPTAYKRHLIVSNVHPRDHIMLVMPSGARVDDGSGFLEGSYADGRRLLRFYSLKDVESKKAELQTVIKKWLETLDKN